LYYVSLLCLYVSLCVYVLLCFFIVLQLVLSDTQQLSRTKLVKCTLIMASDTGQY